MVALCERYRRERDEARALKVPASTEEVLQANMAACVARADLAESRAECERLRAVLNLVYQEAGDSHDKEGAWLSPRTYAALERAAAEGE